MNIILNKVEGVVFVKIAKYLNPRTVFFCEHFPRTRLKISLVTVVQLNSLNFLSS